MDSSQKIPRELSASAWTESQTNVCASLGSRKAPVKSPGNPYASYCGQREALMGNCQPISVVIIKRRRVGYRVNLCRQ